MNDLLLKEYMIPTIGYRISGMYFNSQRTIINQEEFEKIAAQHEEIVLKEDDSFSGIGVHFIGGGG